MGVLKLGKISLDGTKIKANASKHKVLSWKHACKLDKQIKAEVEELLCQAEESDKEDLPGGMSIPDELARREKRLETIAKAKAEIPLRASELYAKHKCTVEPVFSIIKAVMGIRQFMLRGFESVFGEWDLVCIAYNLKRLHAINA